MTLYRRLAAALSDLIPYLHQEVSWLEGDLHDDRFSPRSEDAVERTRRALEETLGRLASCEALIAEARGE